MLKSFKTSTALRIMIKTENLTKEFISFKKAPGLKGSFASFFKKEPISKKAVDNFSFEVKKGEIIGLLGPNGAGKTTLMKMFTGIIVPSEGVSLFLFLVISA